MDDCVKRIGVITDAHANLPAIQAALAALDDAGCDLIIHTGDAIGIGPYPREVLELLLDRPDIVCLMGNHDELFAFDLLKNPSTYLGSGELEHQRWVHAQLSDPWRNQVAQWPYTNEVLVGDVTLHFTHYARQNNAFCDVDKANDAAGLDNLFQSEADVLFFGHHHPRCDVQGKARYINPGALGTDPREGARFALIEREAGSVKVTLKSAPYDAAPVRDALRTRNVPEADFILNVFLKD